MTKNNYLRKKILMGTAVALLLGVLVLNSPLQGTAEITQNQQPPIDVPQPGDPFEIPSDGTPVTLIPGEDLILETPAGVTISLIVGEGVNISVIESSDLPAEAGVLPEEAYGIGLYLTIELNDSEVEVDATISLPYDPAALPEGVAEEQLYFAFYEALTGEWQGVPSWVDTNNGEIHGYTDHFSTWTVISAPDGPPIDVPQPGKPFEVSGNGSAVSLIPGEKLILTTPSGVSINLTVGDSVNISVLESTELPAEAEALPEEAYGLGRYLTIEFDNPEVDVDASISLPYDPAALPEGVAEDQLYFAFYDASTGEWQGVPSWVDTKNGEVHGYTDHFSTWTVMSTPDGPPIDVPQPGDPFKVPGNGSAVSLIPGERLILTTPSGVSINLTVGDSVNISVLESTEIPTEAGPLPEEATGLGRYLSINLSDSEVDVDATLSMPYTDGDLPLRVAEDQLYFAFYDASTGEWQGVPSWVDTTNNVVYANTTHFSTWTVLGKAEHTTESMTDKSTEPTSPATTSHQSLPSLWLDDNVKGGFLAIVTVFTLVLAVAAIINRRQK